MSDWRDDIITVPLPQVHDLDEQTWGTVEVVPIDIANREEVSGAVSVRLSVCLSDVTGR